MTKYRCKNCGYIYTDEDDYNFLTNCIMCEGPKKDISLWNAKEGFYDEEKKKKRVWVSDINPSIQRIDNLCIDCGMCQNICTNITNISYDKQLASNPICINCGQCVMHCPTKALVPKYDYKELLNYLNDTNYFVTISVAPAVRVSIGELFGLPAGSFVEHKLVSALRALKFDAVFDLTFGADMTIMEEASELVERIKSKKNLPQFTSCCPAWVKYCEMFHDDLLDNLSTTKSPISIQGTLINTYYQELNNIPKDKIINVMVAPCVAKKMEVKRRELPGMDYVITVQELALMLQECEIDFNSLKDSDFDPLLGKGSGAGVIFGTSGGVMEAALRAAYYFITNKKAPKKFYNLESIRGISGIKEAEIEIGEYKFKVAAVEGMKNVEEILKHKKDYAFIEVMNCEGGCIGGGGQPLLPIPQVKANLESRKNSLYQNDAESSIRVAYENPDVINVYKYYLDHPLSEKAEKLLHTHYHSRAKAVKLRKEKKTD